MKIKALISLALSTLILVGCGTGTNTSSGSSSGGSSNLTTVKMIQAEVLDTVEPAKARNVKKLNSEDSDLSSSDSDISEPETEISVPEISSEPESSENSSESSSSVPEIVKPIVEVPQYVIIYKDITDITLTITLDNPEAYGIDALRVTCDDPEAQIQVEGEWKPISQEANGTRVVNWSSEDPYEKTYNIRTTSLEDLYTFKVVDIRLAGHDTFLSKQTNSTDFGNNELDMYKMDTDAYELDVVSNTFEEIKFGIKVKEGVTNLSNFKVDGKEPDENGYWVMNESKEDCEISYDFELENGVKVSRSSEKDVTLKNIKCLSGRLFGVGDNQTEISSLYNNGNLSEICNKDGYLEIRLSIEGTGITEIPKMWIGDIELTNIQRAPYRDNYNWSPKYVYYCYNAQLGYNSEKRSSLTQEQITEYTNIFKFKINSRLYRVEKGIGCVEVNNG